jgi:methionyl-tRNA formyltransferase
MNDLTGVKIGFFGTPDFSLKFLNYLYENNAEISFIVTQPASVSGRGKRINPSPVQKWGLEKNLKVYSPIKVNDPNFQKKIKDQNVDFIVIVAYGNLIDDFIINFPKFLTINVHASLLPKWRGAAPIQRSILNNDRETGICIMKVEEKLDAGPIIKFKKIKIKSNDNAGSLYQKMILVGLPLLVEAIKEIMKKNYKMIFQKEYLSTYAKKVKKSETRIRWEENAKEINLKVRAFNPFPGAWTKIRGGDKRIKILKSEIVKKKIASQKKLPIGGVSDNLEVKCGNGSLKVLELQLEGKKALKNEEFLNGYKIKNLIFE